jgi:hypothetical protein
MDGLYRRVFDGKAEKQSAQTAVTRTADGIRLATPDERPERPPLDYETPRPRKGGFLRRWAWTLSFAAVGMALGAISYRARVNLVEGSVVNKAIAGTPLHLFLLITTFPGLLHGMLASFGSEALYLLGILAAQAAVFGVVGLALGCAKRWIFDR